MNIQVLVQWQPSSHEHSWPEYPMWLENVLTNKVLGFRPEFLKGIFTFVFQSAHVIDQRVKPYIRHIALIERNLDSPGQTTLRTGNAKVANRLAQHCYDFVSEAL